MILEDLYNNLTIQRAISPARVTDDTAQVSQTIDMQGQQGLLFAIAIGTLADANATFAVLVEEGDESDMSDAAAVADADLFNTEALAGFQFDNDDEVRVIGYRGIKRYVRITITPSGNTGNADISVVAITKPAIRGTTS